MSANMVPTGKYVSQMERIVQFGEISDQIEACLEKIDEYEDTLVKIEKNDSYLKQPYGFLVFLLYCICLFPTYLIVEDYAWYVIVIALFIVFSVIHNLVDSTVTSNINKKLAVQEAFSKKLERNLDELVDLYLLPEINLLGMATVQNVIDKTSARRISPFLVEHVMEQEVKRGNFEKIALKNDTLYKGKRPESIENIERVFLDID